MNYDKQKSKSPDFHHDDWNEVHEQLLSVQEKSAATSNAGSSSEVVQRKEMGKEFIAADDKPEFVKWIWNTDKISDDNCAKTVTINGISTLGKNVSDENYLSNAMELAAEFKNNPTGYTYTFSRKAASILYYKLENQNNWQIDEGENLPDFADDIAYGPYDACEIPSKQSNGNYHVYSVDRPGLHKYKLMQDLEKQSKYVNDEAHLANFTEMITVKDASGQVVIEQTYDWHSKVYASFDGRRLAYVNDKSEIAPGHIDLKAV